MSYGLEAYNDNGEVQIDGEYVNYSLFESGTWALDTDYRYDSGQQSYFYNGVNRKYFSSPLSEPPIVAFRPSTDYYTCLFSLRQDSSGNYDSVIAVVEVHEEGTISTTIDYAIFSKPLTSKSNEDYGLQAFSSNSELVFDSSVRYCYIIDSRYVNDPFNNCSYDNYENYTVNDAYNNYFILNGSSRDGFYNSAVNKTSIYNTMFKITSQTNIQALGGLTGDGYACLQIEYEGMIGGCYSSSNINLIELNFT